MSVIEKHRILKNINVCGERKREREGDNQITVSEHPVDASTLSESFLSRIANG